MFSVRQQKHNPDGVILIFSDLDFVKTKIKDATLGSFRFYNANVPQNLSDEE